MAAIVVTPSDTRQRIHALDGLRGIAIVVVVLSHGSARLWPVENVSGIGPFEGLFWSGSLGVTILFIVSAFVATQGMLESHTGWSWVDPLRLYLRRFIRIGVQLYPLLLAVLALSAWDSTDTSSVVTTQDSVLSVGSYTWNWYLENHVFTARADLGHLWYLSVEFQFYVALVLAVALLGRRHRRHLIPALIGLIVAVDVWRLHVFHVEGWYRATLRTTTRMDAPLLGVLIALSLPYLQRYRRYAQPAAWLSGAVMAAIVLTSSGHTPFDYLLTQGIVFSIAAAVFVAAILMCPASSNLILLLGSVALRTIGTAALAIYLWHVPLFLTLSRHTTHWDWVPRTLLGFGLLAAIVVTAQLLIERPAQRWLGRHLRPPRREPVSDAYRAAD